MSDELIAPDALISNLKLVASVVCSERAFTLLMSLEFTECELLTSPMSKPAEAVALTALLTPLSEIVARLLLEILVTVTVTSLAVGDVAIAPMENHAKARLLRESFGAMKLKSRCDGQAIFKKVAMLSVIVDDLHAA